MAPKQLKTRAELVDLYTREFVARYGGLPPGVETILVEPKRRAAPQLPNWNVVAVGGTGLIRSLNLRLVETDLQILYDLSETPLGDS